MQHVSYQAGGYDWLATWRRMYDDEREQAERVTPPEFAVQADFWASQAGRVAAIARQTPQPDGFMSFLLPHLRPSDRLLDIGAGAGRYEPVLARAVAEVVALEPSHLVVSLGVDAGASDPESPLEVSNPGFRAAGERLASLGLPTVLVQEGGYQLEALGPDVMAVLAAFR